MLGFLITTATWAVLAHATTPDPCPPHLAGAGAVGTDFETAARAAVLDFWRESLGTNSTEAYAVVRGTSLADGRVRSMIVDVVYADATGRRRVTSFDVDVATDGQLTVHEDP